MKWISAKPLQGFSSLNEGFIWNSLGLKFGRISSLISFNVETSLPREIASPITIHSHPSNETSVARPDFRIDQLKQWELDLTPFKSFDDYLTDQLNCKQRSNYHRTEKHFTDSGCTFTIIEGDWSAYADKAYSLYHNVASKYMQIYDLGFFHATAKLQGYNLICAWQGDKLIGTVVMIEEGSTIHSMGCGLDYQYSKKSYSYSKLHYEFIRYAIDKGRFKVADAGVTADQAKESLGMCSKPAVIEIFVQNPLLRGVLRLAQTLLKVSLNSNNVVSIRPRWPAGATKAPLIPLE